MLARLNDVARLASITAVLLLMSGGGGVAAGQDAAPGAEQPPVSADRIQEALQRPALKIPPVPLDTTPIFRSKVEGEWPLETPLQVIRRELAEEAHGRRPGVAGTAGGAAPLMSVDLLEIAASVRNALQQSRRQHAEAEARQMVQEELDEFCRVHDCSATGGVGVAVAEGVIPAK